MYNLVSVMWRMGRITEDQVDALVLQGRLTEAQAEEIKALPRVG